MKSGPLYAALFGVMLVGTLLTASCMSTTYWNTPNTYSGAELYATFCANCHGRAGHGDGPVAPLLKSHVPDLTLLAARHDGKFPEDEVFKHIDGQAGDPTHGPRNMPVWGYEFFGDSPDDEEAHAQADHTINKLVKYVRSIQRPYH